MKLLLCILAVAFALGGHTADRRGLIAAKNVSSGGGGGGSLLSEDFEGAGAPSGWTSSGTVDWDSTTYTMGGAQNLLITSTGGYAAYDLGADYNELWVRFKFTPEISDGTARDFISLRSAADAQQALLENTGQDIRATHGSTVTSISAVDCLTASALNYVWIRYVYDSGGGNGTLTVYAGNSGTRGSAVHSVTTGTGAAVRIIRLHCENAVNDSAFDDILVQTTDPGNF